MVDKEKHLFERVDGMKINWTTREELNKKIDKMLAEEDKNEKCENAFWNRWISSCRMWFKKR
jgi:hypothetical protein